MKLFREIREPTNSVIRHIDQFLKINNTPNTNSSSGGSIVQTDATKKDHAAFGQQARLNLSQSERHQKSTPGGKPDTVTSIHWNGATDVARKMQQGEDLTLHDKVAMFQALNRKWRRYLTPTEMSVMLYLLDRSVGWGNDSFTAMTTNVLNGNEEYAGIGLSRRTYYATLKALEAKQMIIRRSVRDATKITINVGWSPEDADMLPIPKGLKAKAENGTEDDQKSGYCTPRSAGFATPRSAGFAPQNTVVSEYSKKDTEAVADAPTSGVFARPRKQVSPEKKESRECLGVDKEFGQWDDSTQPAVTLPAPVRQAASRTTALDAVKAKLAGAVAADHRRAETKTTRALTSAKSLKATDVELIWRNALTETFSMVGHVVWSIKDKGRVNVAIKKWAYAEVGTFGALVDYAVRNWTQIVDRKLSWMKQNPAPRTPEMGFFLFRMVDFLTVWQSRELDRFANDMDQPEYDRLKARGLTHEEAIRAMARKDAVGALREEMEKREDTVARRDQVAQRREERAERLEKFTESLTPVTPDQPAEPDQPANGKRIAMLPDGQQVQITPGTPRRPGQVWGHTPTIRLIHKAPEPVQPVATLPTTDRPAADMPAYVPLPSWDEIQARRKAEMAIKREEHRKVVEAGAAIERELFRPKEPKA